MWSQFRGPDLIECRQHRTTRVRRVDLARRCLLAGSLAAVTLLGGACQAAWPSSPGSTGLASSSPDPHLAPAIDFRKRFGLRSDEGWVRDVASQPTAQRAVERYGVPLMPFESAELDARAATAEDIRPVLEAYGEKHPDEFGGVFIDHVASGALVALFTGNLSEHEIALRQSLQPGADFEVRRARWTLVQLDSLQTRIVADKDWLNESGMELVSVGVPIERNLVELRLRAQGEDIASDVINHFEGQGMLDIEIQGVPLGSVPKGALRGIVLDAQGRPVAGVDIEAVSLQPGVVFHTGDIALGTRDDGSFLIPEMPAVEYEIRVTRLVGDGQFVLLGKARVDVVAGGVTSVRINLRD